MFALRLLIFRCRIEKLSLFNCSDMAMKFSTEKYGESIYRSLPLKKFLSGSVLSLDNTDSKEKKLDSKFSNVSYWFWTATVLKSM